MSPAQLKRLRDRREQIGRRLRDAREARGLTQADLGRLIGCAKSHVSQIESATGSPSFKLFLAVCDALHADPALLFAEVPVANLGDMYRHFEKWVATIGAEAMEFLLSLDEGEMKLLCERGVEAIQYHRALRAGRASAPAWPKGAQ